MPKIFYTEDEFDHLKFEFDKLTNKVADLEILRPIWALSTTPTPGSLAEYSTSAALYTIWAMLKVTNQTECVQKLDALIQLVEDCKAQGLIR